MTIKVQTTTSYITTDGKSFGDSASAEVHQYNLESKGIQLRSQYLNSWSFLNGKDNLYMFIAGGPLEQAVRTWLVRGEDPNCDIGGHHHQPHIGYVTGTFEKAIAWAVLQPKWVAWGAGGDISLVESTVL